MVLFRHFIKSTLIYSIKYLKFIVLIYKRSSLGPLAQLVEHLPFKEGVDGSSPSGLTNYNTLIGGYLIITSEIQFSKF